MPLFPIVVLPDNVTTGNWPAGKIRWRIHFHFFFYLFHQGERRAPYTWWPSTSVHVMICALLAQIKAWSKKWLTHLLTDRQAAPNDLLDTFILTEEGSYLSRWGKRGSTRPPVQKYQKHSTGWNHRMTNFLSLEKRCWWKLGKRYEKPLMSK